MKYSAFTIDSQRLEAKIVSSLETAPFGHANSSPIQFMQMLMLSEKAEFLN